MHFEGSQIQNAIYVSGGRPGPSRRDAWEARAREVLDPGPFGYIAGGAGNEATMRANLEAFQRRRLRPRMLTGNPERDISVEVLGTPSPAPFLLAPIGVLSIAHADGELAVARAAASTARPVHALERGVALDRGDRRRAWATRRAGSSSTGSTTARSRRASSSARRPPATARSSLTVDTLTLGWRPRDLRNAYLPFIQGEGCAQFFTDPVFRSRLDAPPEEDLLTAAVRCSGRSRTCRCVGRPRLAARADRRCRSS